MNSEFEVVTAVHSTALV